jgi:hypothetical protein
VPRRTPPAVSVTSAPQSLAADQSRRASRYLLQMGVRVACFLLAVLLWRHVPVWVSILLIVGAVVLPYTAVLFANAGRERVAGGTAVDLPQLSAGPATRPAAPRPTDGRTTDHRAAPKDTGDSRASGDSDDRASHDRTTDERSTDDR